MPHTPRVIGLPLPSAPMDRPPPDPQKLLDHWMEWERGETTPGSIMKNLKLGGLRELLEQLAGGTPS